MLPDWMVEPAKQVPALAVLVTLVVLFLNHLKDARKADAEDRKADSEQRAADRSTIAEIVRVTTEERRETSKRIEEISNAAHETANETKEKFIAAINQMQLSLSKLENVIESRTKA